MVSGSGVRVSGDVCFRDPESINAKEICESLGEDLILKPTDQGSSVALYVIRGLSELENALGEIQTGNWIA